MVVLIPGGSDPYLPHQYLIYRFHNLHQQLQGWFHSLKQRQRSCIPNNHTSPESLSRLIDELTVFLPLFPWEPSFNSPRSSQKWHDSTALRVLRCHYCMTFLLNLTSPLDQSHPSLFNPVSCSINCSQFSHRIQSPLFIRYRQLGNSSPAVLFQHVIQHAVHSTLALNSHSNKTPQNTLETWLRPNLGLEGSRLRFTMQKIAHAPIKDHALPFLQPHVWINSQADFIFTVAAAGDDLIQRVALRMVRAVSWRLGLGPTFPKPGSWKQSYTTIISHTYSENSVRFPVGEILMASAVLVSVALFLGYCW